MEKMAFSGLVGSPRRHIAGLVGSPRGNVGASVENSIADLVNSAAEEQGIVKKAEESNTALYVGLGLVAILAAAWALSSKKG